MMPNAESLEAIYFELGSGIRAFLRRRVADANAAEELLQETFLAVARNPAALFAAKSKRAWLIGIATNLVREHLRRHARNRTVTLTADIPGRMDEVEDLRADALRAAIEQLPEANRDVLELRLVEELSYAEIAECLKLPIGTVRSRIHNAVLRLRDEMTAMPEKQMGGREQREKRHVTR